MKDFMHFFHLIISEFHICFFLCTLDFCQKSPELLFNFKIN